MASTGERFEQELKFGQRDFTVRLQRVLKDGLVSDCRCDEEQLTELIDDWSTRQHECFRWREEIQISKSLFRCPEILVQHSRFPRIYIFCVANDMQRRIQEMTPRVALKSFKVSCLAFFNHPLEVRLSVFRRLI